MKRTKGLALLLAALMLLGLLAGCTPKSPDTPATEGADAQAQTPTLTQGESQTPQGGETVQGQTSPDLTPMQLEQTKTAADYGEVLTLLRSVTSSWHGYDDSKDSAVEEPAEAPMSNDAAAPTAAAAGEGGAGYGDGDFGTNVQVAGVDELDAVKTDGSYIYILTERGFLILKADGANTEILCRVNVLEEDEALEEEDTWLYTYRYSGGLFVGENRLALLYHYSDWGEVNGVYQDTSAVRIAFYDTTDKANPVLLADLGQEGYFNGARMIDGTLYLISTDYAEYPDEDAEPEDYIPCVYNGAQATLLPADRIYLCPEPDSSSFTVLGSYSLQEAKLLDNCAFTDACDTVYMNADALYLARTVSRETTSEPYTENQYSVVDYSYQSCTEIKKIDLKADALALAATGTVAGSLLNQFSMDVYEGNLRLATTVWQQAYSVYTDETYGWENYNWKDSGTDNCLTVLDGNLQQIGVLDHLVEDEQIYSVRFIGTLGYIVTYESIDPVFAIDLSDPTAPKLLSALELPGVSDYLHPFTDGKLLGVGRAVNTDAVSEGVQLSMFDVSDPANVTLEGQLVIPDSYSPALYDHHAVMVNTGRNVIALPISDNNGMTYSIYAYENGGFTENARVPIGYYADNARGLLIGDDLYVCSEGVTYVISLTGYEVVAEVSDAMG